MTTTRTTAPPTTTWTNWARTVTAHPVEIARPCTVEEVAAVVRSAAERGLCVKVVGAGHSFTPIAATDGVLVDLSGLTGLLGVDLERRQVRLAAGTRLHQLPALLGPHGLALENLGDIDQQTVAGATSTGTHGTGAGYRGLAHRIEAARLVTADGSVLEVSPSSNADLLPAVRLGLGALGILVELTVQCVPAFLLRAEEGSADLGVLDDPGFFTSTDHVEAYWFPGTTTLATKRNTRLPADTAFTPPSRAARWVDQRLVQNGLLRAACELGVRVPAVTPTVNRLATRALGTTTYTDHAHAVFTSPRTVRFRECEYAVPREALPEAVRELVALVRRRGWRISFPVELRVAAADDLWLSTATGRDSGYLAVHRFWREDHQPYFGEVEALMRSFEGRPHWGKLHSQDAESLRRVYPRFEDFLAVRDRLDPDRVFGNDYLRRVLGD